MIDVKPTNTNGPAAPRLRGELRSEEPMARHTSWRVGGPAKRFYTPADIDDLRVFMAGVEESEPLLWIGLGSNLLVRDGGVRGTVIHTGELGGLSLCDDGSVRVEAGVSCPKAARFCARHDLCGAEFLAGIPGTMGGALAMNAGAFGGETWDLVTAVETVDRHGDLHHRRPDEYRIAYREVSGPANEWFVAACLRPTSGDGHASQAKIKTLLSKRAESQPIQQHSCGSVFRNPPGDHAGRLVEACGLKDAHVGGARVSAKHANFIVNTGGATAADIEQLIHKVRDAVMQAHGVALIPEVKIVGDARD